MPAAFLRSAEPGTAPYRPASGPTAGGRLVAIRRMRVAVDGRALRPGAARARGVARYLRSRARAAGAAVSRGRATSSSTLAGPPADRGAEPAGPASTGWRRGATSSGSRHRLPSRSRPAVPYVLTVHDLSFEHRPLDYSALRPRCGTGSRARRGSPAARRARPVRTPRPPARPRSGPGTSTRARTTNGAVGARAAPAAGREARRADFPNGYFLAVGALEPRKLPSAIAGRTPPARARSGLARGARIRGRRAARAASSRAPGATLLGHVSDEALDALYSGALARGVRVARGGLRLHPAGGAARGTPAIVADLPVFDETFGDAALRVPLGRPGRAGRGAASARARARTSANGSRRTRRAAVERLSWERTARETRAALAGGGRRERASRSSPSSTTPSRSCRGCSTRSRASRSRGRA